MVTLLETKVLSATTNRTSVHGTGHGGGLWICWDPQTIIAELVHESAQHVTLSRSFSDNSTPAGSLRLFMLLPTSFNADGFGNPPLSSILNEISTAPSHLGS